jgi:TPR repeat protein
MGLYRTYYESGIGVDADYPRALEYFGKSASKGYVPAAERLNLPEKTKIKAVKPVASSSVDCLIM